MASIQFEHEDTKPGETGSPTTTTSPSEVSTERIANFRAQSYREQQAAGPACSGRPPHQSALQKARENQASASDLTSDATFAISEVASLELSPRPTTTTLFPSKARFPRREQVCEALPPSGPSCSPEHVWFRPDATTRKSNVSFFSRPSGPTNATTYPGIAVLSSVVGNRIEKEENRLEARVLESPPTVDGTSVAGGVK